MNNTEMKKIVAGILRRGFTTSKKVSAKGCRNYLYPLQYILEDTEPGLGMTVRCNSNPFWDPQNNKRIHELMYDILGIHRHNIMDTCYFNILNRFENGDRYGIVVPETCPSKGV